MCDCVSLSVCLYASLSVCCRLGFGGGGRQGMTKVKAVMCHFRCWRAGTRLQGCPLCQTHSDICGELSRCLFFFCSLHLSLSLSNARAYLQLHVCAPAHTTVLCFKKHTVEQRLCNATVFLNQKPSASYPTCSHRLNYVKLLHLDHTSATRAWLGWMLFAPWKVTQYVTWNTARVQEDE